jgi:hypothetical protein
VRIRIVAPGSRDLDRSYTLRDWEFLLHIAVEYGWDPAGPEDNSYRPEEGHDGYCPPPDDLLKLKFEADPALRAHYRTFENYRHWQRVSEARLDLFIRLAAYGAVDGQYVTPDDARNLSLALSSALNDHLSVLPRLAFRFRYFERGDPMPEVDLSEVSEEELGKRIMWAVGDTFRTGNKSSQAGQTGCCFAGHGCTGWVLHQGIRNVRLPRNSPRPRQKQRKTLN